MEKVIKELEKMEKYGIKTLVIYYAEDIKEGSDKWSIDVMQDDLCDLCEMGWAWTVMSFSEFKCLLYGDDDLIYVCNDWEIVVDKLFSDEVICNAINAWLNINGIKIKVEMIDIKDASGSGYVKDLKERMSD